MTVLPLRSGQHRAVARPARTLRPDTAVRLAAALGEQYSVVRRLGAGGYGEVFLVRDALLHRVLAVKVLRDALAADARERERFRREARTVAHLAHPGIVPVLAYGETEDGEDAPLCWTMMPCASGGSLATRLSFGGRMRAGETVGILLALAEALAHAHRHGVVHCDLKPDNVLFAAGDGRPLLTDFGVAALPDRDRGIGAAPDIGGTPAWMAPEQRLGLGVLDARSDVHALGMLGWVMLTSRLPERFPHGRLDRAALPSDCPEPLARVLERALEREPDARWESADAMRAALARAGQPAWRRRGAAFAGAVVALARRSRRRLGRLRLLP